MKTALKDLFLPSPIGGGFRMDGYWVWCGSVVLGEDNKYHMFASRWKKDVPMHPGWLIKSEVVRAVSDTPEGPFTFEEVVLPARGAQFWDGRSTHNPHIKKIDDTYVLYYMGTTHPFPDNYENTDAVVTCARANKRIGIAISKSVFGPWKRTDFPILSTRPNYFDNFLTSNPAPCVLDNGNVFMMYKARNYIDMPYNRPLHGSMMFGMAKADSFNGTYKHMSEKPLFGTSAEFEDPFIWHDMDGFNMIAKDMDGSISGEHYGGVHALSQDGIHWELEKDVLFYSRKIPFSDGVVREMANMERPFILFHKDKPTHIYFATSDGKPETGFVGCDNTWNMVIPLKSL